MIRLLIALFVGLALVMLLRLATAARRVERERPWEQAPADDEA